MRVGTALAAVVWLSAGLAAAQAPVTPGLPPPQVVPPEKEKGAPAPGADAQSPATTPDLQAPAVPAPTAPGAPAPTAAPAVPLSRTFTSKAGLLFNTVRPERVKDFEAVMWYLQQALEKSTDPTVRAQAQGWKIFRAVEPGPNAVILYVFGLDPAVPGADYSLGRILADAYPEQIREIWAMYTGSVTSGGSILNLNEVELMPPTPLVPPTPGSLTPGATPPTGTAPAAGTTPPVGTRTPPPATTTVP
jgi:hypothetical protein